MSNVFHMHVSMHLVEIVTSFIIIIVVVNDLAIAKSNQKTILQQLTHNHLIT
jgi:hypothetical protein